MTPRSAGSAGRHAGALGGGPASVPEGDRVQATGTRDVRRRACFKDRPTGREITLYRIGAGEICIPERQCHPEPGNRCRRRHRGSSVCEAVMIPADALREWVRRQELWREFVFELISQRLLRVLKPRGARHVGLRRRRLDGCRRGIAHDRIDALRASVSNFVARTRRPKSAATRWSSRSKLPSAVSSHMEPRGGYTRLYGSVTGADMRGNIEDVCRDARFQEQRYHILDFSDATEFTATRKSCWSTAACSLVRRSSTHQGHDCCSRHAGERKGDSGKAPCARRVPLRGEDVCIHS